MLVFENSQTLCTLTPRANTFWYASNCPQQTKLRGNKNHRVHSGLFLSKEWLSLAGTDGNVCMALWMPSAETRASFKQPFRSQQHYSCISCAAEEINASHTNTPGQIWRLKATGESSLGCPFALQSGT